MRFINTRVHGMLDYGMGVLLIAAPWLLNFARGGAETYVPVVLGVGVILYSLITRYELGVLKVLPMGAHLAMDFFGGLFLAVSPWLFGFNDYIVWPHVLFGILEMGAALMTQRYPALSHAAAAHATNDHGHVAHV